MMDSHGCGLSSVRFICGTQDIHKVIDLNLFILFVDGIIDSHSHSDVGK